MSRPAPKKGTHYQLSGTGCFVLVGSQRSGTNFFREVLNTNPQAAVHGEVLWPYPAANVWHNYIRTAAVAPYPPKDPREAGTLIDDYLVYLVDDTRRSWTSKGDTLGMVGVDIKYNQLRYIAPLTWGLSEKPFLLRYLGDRNIPIVHMIRENIVKQALSLTIAEARNVYHNYAGETFDTKLEITPKRLLQFCNWVYDERNEFDKLSSECSMLTVTYEAVAAACAAPGADGSLAGHQVMRDLSDFLGIENAFRNPTSIKKVINRPYSEILTNYKQIVKALKGTKFERFAADIQ